MTQPAAPRRTTLYVPPVDAPAPQPPRGIRALASRLFARSPLPSDTIEMRRRLDTLIHPRIQRQASQTDLVFQKRTDLEFEKLVQNATYYTIFSLMFMTTGAFPDADVFFKLIQAAKAAGPNPNLYEIFIREREQIGQQPGKHPPNVVQRLLARLAYFIFYKSSTTIECTIRNFIREFVKLDMLRDPAKRGPALTAILSKLIGVIDTSLNIYIGAKQKWAAERTGGSVDDYVTTAIQSHGDLNDLYKKFTHHLFDTFFPGLSFFPKLRERIDQKEKSSEIWRWVLMPVRLFFWIADFTLIAIANKLLVGLFKFQGPKLIKQGVETSLNVTSSENLSFTNSLDRFLLEQLRAFHKEIQEKGFGDEVSAPVENADIKRAAARIRELTQIEPLNDPSDILQKRLPYSHWITSNLAKVNPRLLNQKIEESLASAISSGLDYSKEHTEEILGNFAGLLNSMFEPQVSRSLEELRNEHDQLVADRNNEFKSLLSDSIQGLILELGECAPGSITSRRATDTKESFVEATSTSLRTMDEALRSMESSLRASPPHLFSETYERDLSRFADAIQLFDNWRQAQAKRWAKLTTEERLGVEDLADKMIAAMSKSIDALERMKHSTAEWREKHKTLSTIGQLSSLLNRYLNSLTLSTDEYREQLRAQEESGLDRKLAILTDELARKERMGSEPTELAQLHLFQSTFWYQKLQHLRHEGNAYREALQARLPQVEELLRAAESASQRNLSYIDLLTSELEVLRKSQDDDALALALEDRIEDTYEYRAFSIFKRRPDELLTQLTTLTSNLAHLRETLPPDLSRDLPHLPDLNELISSLLKEEKRYVTLLDIDTSPLQFELNNQREPNPRLISDMKRLIEKLSPSEQKDLLPHLQGVLSQSAEASIHLGQFETKLTALKDRQKTTRDGAIRALQAVLEPQQLAAEEYCNRLIREAQETQEAFSSRLPDLRKTLSELSLHLETIQSPDAPLPSRSSFTKRALKTALVAGGALGGAYFGLPLAAAEMIGSAALSTAAAAGAGAIGSATGATLLGKSLPHLFRATAPPMARLVKPAAEEVFEHVLPLATNAPLYRSLVITAMRSMLPQ